jgi:hypothetical protein
MTSPTMSRTEVAVRLVRPNKEVHNKSIILQKEVVFGTGTTVPNAGQADQENKIRRNK